MKRLLFIAVVYNNIDQTRDLCESLLFQELGGYELSLILVDNSDQLKFKVEIDLLAEEYAFASVLRPKGNIGYFPAITQALMLYAKDFDIVIAGNNDLKYDKNFSKILSNSVYEEDVMVVCPDVITSDGCHQNPHHKFRLGFVEKLYFDIYFSNFYLSKVVNLFRNLFPFIAKFFGRSTFSIRGKNVPQVIDQGIGAVYIFQSRFLSIINYKLYYPGFLYGEEACLSWQVRSSCGRIWYDPSLIVLHAESSTLGKISKYATYAISQDSYWKIRNIL